MNDHSQRSASYGEILELQEIFNQQVKEKNIVFKNDEYREESFFDFLQQYLEGNDNPEIHI